MDIRADGTLQQRTSTTGLGTLFLALALVAMAAMAIYLCARVALVTMADYTGLDIPVTLALLLAETFILLHAFGYVLSVVRALSVRRPVPAAILRDPADFPEVDVLVAARHEPKEILERTLTALTGMSYPNKTIWLLDDSSDPRYIREAAQLAERFGARLFRRDERHGAKAGVVNDALKHLQGKYLAVFDADQSPLPFFLNRIVPLLEADPKLAFVQTPQFYANMSSNRVASAAGSQQAIFYEYICEAKASSGTAFCCGTNVVFRREALQAVGGLDETSVTEDFATSVKLHTAGWQSLYYGETYVMGLGPTSLPAYFRQQFRWARGTLGVGLRLVKQFFTRPHSLGFWQWVDYGLSGSFYLVGWSYLILMLCPALYVVFGIPSYFVRPEVYAAAFLPYLLFAVMVFIGGLRRRHYSLDQMVQGQLLGLLAAPVHILASLAVVFRIGNRFGVTPKGETTMVPLRLVWPQVAICAISFVVFIWGMSRSIFEHDLAAGINAFWAGIHFAVFWSVLYFREIGARPATADVRAATA